MPLSIDAAYKTLEVSETASDTEIKKKYNKLSLKYHPDKNPNQTESEKDQYNAIITAFEIIKKQREHEADRLSHDLYLAVYAGDLELVKSYLDKGANPNRNNNYPPNNFTPLWAAVLNNNLEIAKILLTHPSNKADPNFTYRDGRSVLFLAVDYRQLEMISLLLKHQANANSTDSNYETPVLQAALFSNKEFFKDFLALLDKESFILSMKMQLMGGANILHIMGNQPEKLNVFIEDEKFKDKDVQEAFTQALESSDQNGETPIDLMSIRIKALTTVVIDNNFSNQELTKIWLKALVVFPSHLKDNFGEYKPTNPEKRTLGEQDIFEKTVDGPDYTEQNTLHFLAAQKHELLSSILQEVFKKETDHDLKNNFSVLLNSRDSMGRTPLQIFMDSQPLERAINVLNSIFKDNPDSGFKKHLFDFLNHKNSKGDTVLHTYPVKELDSLLYTVFSKTTNDVVQGMFAESLKNKGSAVETPFFSLVNSESRLLVIFIENKIFNNEMNASIQLKLIEAIKAPNNLKYTPLHNLASYQPELMTTMLGNFLKSNASPPIKQAFAEALIQQASSGSNIFHILAKNNSSLLLKILENAVFDKPDDMHKTLIQALAAKNSQMKTPLELLPPKDKELNSRIMDRVAILEKKIRAFDEHKAPTNPLPRSSIISRTSFSKADPDRSPSNKETSKNTNLPPLLRTTQSSVTAPVFNQNPPLLPSRTILAPITGQLPTGVRSECRSGTPYTPIVAAPMTAHDPLSKPSPIQQFSRDLRDLELITGGKIAISQGKGRDAGCVFINFKEDTQRMQSFKETLGKKFPETSKQCTNSLLVENKIRLAPELVKEITHASNTENKHTPSLPTLRGAKK